MQPPAQRFKAPRRAIFATPLALGLGLTGMAESLEAGKDKEGATTLETTVEHLHPEGMHRNPAFSQAVVVANPGRTIYIGGQNAVNAQGEIVGKGDLAAQTEQIFENLGIVLEAAGVTLHDIVKWTIFIVEGQDLRPGFEVFQKRWGMEHQPPAVTAAMVASLAHPDFLVEIEAIAVTSS